MIQVRNVPDAVHRSLKVRAAVEGLSLSEYLNRELLRLVETPMQDEMLDRLARLPPVDLPFPIEDLVRAEREAH
ncbi:MAG: hypothetical protein HYX52_02325 [Chloroflexi bacterium]|nr:hypothetical protein [Chloroflexota bacterium]